MAGCMRIKKKGNKMCILWSKIFVDNCVPFRNFKLQSSTSELLPKTFESQFERLFSIYNSAFLSYFIAVSKLDRKLVLPMLEQLMVSTLLFIDTIEDTNWTIGRITFKLYFIEKELCETVRLPTFIFHF